MVDGIFGKRLSMKELRVSHLHLDYKLPVIKLPTKEEYAGNVLHDYQLNDGGRMREAVKQLCEKQERTAQEGVICAQDKFIRELEAKLAGLEVDVTLEGIISSFIHSRASGQYALRETHHSASRGWYISARWVFMGVRFKIATPTVSTKREALVIAVSLIEQKKVELGLS